MNKRIHWLCVPTILLSTVGLFWLIRFPFLTPYFDQSLHPWLNAAVPLVVGVLLFYLRMSLTIFAGMVFVAGGALILSFVLQNWLGPWFGWVMAGVFLVAWAGQFWGHKIEGKKPSFLKDLQFLFVGPAWVLAFVYRRLGIPF